MSPKDLITPFHAEFGLVNEQTRIRCVGEQVIAMHHVCGPVAYPRTVREHPKVNSVCLALIKPSHNLLATAFCQKCNVLYIGADHELVSPRASNVSPA